VSRSFSALAQGTPALLRGLPGALIASALGTASLESIQAITLVLTSSALVVVSLGRLITQYLTGAGVGAAALGKGFSTVLSASALGQASTTRLLSYLSTLVASATGATALDATFVEFIFRTLTAEATGLASIASGRIQELIAEARGEALYVRDLALSLLAEAESLVVLAFQQGAALYFLGLVAFAQGAADATRSIAKGFQSIAYGVANLVVPGAVIPGRGTVQTEVIPLGYVTLDESRIATLGEVTLENGTLTLDESILGTILLSDQLLGRTVWNDATQTWDFIEGTWDFYHAEDLTTIQ
jgi:hypothetical protein